MLEKELTQSVHINISQQKLGNGKLMKILEHCLSQRPLAIRNMLMIPFNWKVTNGVRSTKLILKNYG